MNENSRVCTELKSVICLKSLIMTGSLWLSVRPLLVESLVIIFYMNFLIHYAVMLISYVFVAAACRLKSEQKEKGK